MDRFEALTAITAILGGCVTAVTVVYLIAKATIRSRQVAELPEGSVARLEQRLERMEQAIDAIAVEMERVSEGQRFTTRLLSERAPERLES